MSFYVNFCFPFFIVFFFSLFSRKLICLWTFKILLEHIDTKASVTIEVDHFTMCLYICICVYLFELTHAHIDISLYISVPSIWKLNIYSAYVQYSGCSYWTGISVRREYASTLGLQTWTRKWSFACITDLFFKPSTSLQFSE